MRLFFAAMLPPEVQSDLGRLRRQLDWLPVHGNWSPPESLHITLKFLGEMPDSAVMPLIQSVHRPAAAARPLTLRADHLVFFPPSAPARVLGIGFTGDVEPIILLQRHLELTAAEQGVSPENRAYVPHATLARFRDGLHARHRPRIEQSCGELSRLPEFSITEFQLMQSILDSRGSRYIRVASFPF